MSPPQFNPHQFESSSAADTNCVDRRNSLKNLLSLTRRFDSSGMFSPFLNRREIRGYQTKDIDLLRIFKDVGDVSMFSFRRNKVVSVSAESGDISRRPWGGTIRKK